MEIVIAVIVALCVGLSVGTHIERKRSEALHYSHLSGSDYLFMHGGELTGKWQRVRRDDGSAVGV